MHAGDAAGSIDWSPLVEGLRPFLPWIVLLVALLIVLAAPMPGRGPGVFARRDPWRTFKYDARRAVLGRAGNRCEGPLLLAWGRCRAAAEEADHIYPWSKGGATIVSNGQALCRRHNRSKRNATPPWWYVLALERRRRKYFPVGLDARVRGRMRSEDRALRGQ